MKTRRQHQQFTEPAPKCIWMQAGVVQNKHCRFDFACRTCRFDKALQRIAGQNDILRRQGRTPEGNRGNISFWQERLKALPPAERPCIHHMKGRIGFRSCTHAYQCSNCEFDQYFQDEFTVHAVVKPVSVLDVAGFKIPQGYYLHQGHAWMKLEENSEVRIGIDDFAMRVFGPPHRITSPLVGKVVTQNQAAMSFHRDTHSAQVCSPVSGVVTAINAGLRERGNISNAHPYEDGWIMRVHAADLRRDIKALMIGSETEQFFKSEIDQLMTLIEQEAGPLAADGGYLGNDIYGSMPQLGWNALKNQFLERLK